MKRLLIGALFGAVVLAALIGVFATHGIGGHSASAWEAQPPKRDVARPCSSYRGNRPSSCISRNGFACSSYEADARPLDCLSPPEQKKEVAAQRAATATAQVPATQPTPISDASVRESCREQVYGSGLWSFSKTQEESEYLKCLSHGGENWMTGSGNP